MAGDKESKEVKEVLNPVYTLYCIEINQENKNPSYLYRFVRPKRDNNCNKHLSLLDLLTEKSENSRDLRALMREIYRDYDSIWTQADYQQLSLKNYVNGLFSQNIDNEIDNERINIRPLNKEEIKEIGNIFDEWNYSQIKVE